MSFINKLFSYFEIKLSQKRIAIFKTIYFNFRCLPFNQAIYLPIILYGKLRLKNLSGKIVFTTFEPKYGLCRIGADLCNYRTKSCTTLTIDGTLRLGHHTVICQGASILISKNCILEINDYSTLGDNAEIICKNKISIGKHVDVTWDCQITDFSSHPVMDVSTGKFSELYSFVEIGDYCWLGNRSTVMPGTKLPNRTIVASNSLLNKNYIELGIKEYSLLGGIPAKLIKEDFKRTDYESDN